MRLAMHVKVVCRAPVECVFHKHGVARISLFDGSAEEFAPDWF